LAHPTFILCAGIHSGWEDHNTDAHVNIADDPLASYKNLVNFGPVTSFVGVFTPGGLHATLYHTFLVPTDLRNT